MPRGVPSVKHLVRGSAVARASKFFFRCASAAGRYGNRVPLRRCPAPAARRCVPMRFEVVIPAGAQRLPDAGKIRPALGSPRNGRRLRGDAAAAPPASTGQRPQPSPIGTRGSSRVPAAGAGTGVASSTSVPPSAS